MNIVLELGGILIQIAEDIILMEGIFRHRNGDRLAWVLTAPISTKTTGSILFDLK
jgi:hypothetical protein